MNFVDGEPSGKNPGVSLDMKERWITRSRINLVAIALFIYLIYGGIVLLIYQVLPQAANNQLVVGALIGLLRVGHTGLAGLGTTLVNEGDSNEPPNPNTSGPAQG